MKIIDLKPGADPKTVQLALQKLGLWTTVHLPQLAGQGTKLLVQSDSALVSPRQVEEAPGVQGIWAPRSTHPLVDELQARGPVMLGGGKVRVGPGQEAVLFAGPCSVESEAQIHQAAAMVAAAGARVLRGGCFKPRTNPYSFQGVGMQGLEWMRQAADEQGLCMVTEAMGTDQVEQVATMADLLQVGARNMQNFDLLHVVGRMGKPVLLKRGLSATISEWFQAAEHLLHAGAAHVLFCERGIRSFDPTTRFLLDLAAVAQLHHIHGLPVIVDPSHATGRKDLIGPMGRAGLGAGAHGLIVEAHPKPEHACSDGPQQLDQAELGAAVKMWNLGTTH